MKAEAVEIIRKGNAPFRKALYYKKLGNGSVACLLCPRGCIISSGSTGFCRARQNLKGTLYALGYASPCAIHTDPIEKKPFFNFLPRSRSYSIACAGCNLRCKYCQNWDISQSSPLDTINYAVPPEGVARAAGREGCRTIAYTYTEPTNFYEYMLDTAKAAHEAGILNIYHSNGFINQGPLKELIPFLDAANIDLKGFTTAFYRNVCEGELETVLETLKTLKQAGVWVEITNLVIPGINDDQGVIGKMAEWIRGNLGPETPLHFSRFFPLYKMIHISPTPVETLERARGAACRAGLMYVYIGNVPGHSGENTYCPKCEGLMVKRSGYSVLEMHIKGGRCPACGTHIHGRWS